MPTIRGWLTSGDLDIRKSGKLFEYNVYFLACNKLSLPCSVFDSFIESKYSSDQRLNLS